MSESLSERVRAAVRDRITALALPALAGVYEQMMPDDTDVKFPCVLLTQDGLADRPLARTTGYKIVGKCVRVVVADRHDAKFDHRKLPWYERTREALEAAFDGRPLAGVPECSLCRIDEFPLVEPNVKGYLRFMTGFLVIAVCREDLLEA